MKFTAEGKDLKSAIALCERAADRKSTMPILANVKLDVGNNCHATLTATDLGVWAMVDVPAQCASARLGTGVSA
jgi:DNA polymerase III sliding clamp (beta) subunit (PCNA family)